MKILHITTSLTGGAGIAALRSHLALVKKGVDSRILHLGAATNKPSSYTQATYQPTFFQKVLHLIHLETVNIYRQYTVSVLAKTAGLEVFSLPYSDYHLHKNPLVEWADVVHLHWVSGFINYPNFFPNVKKPIVWTLHDMNPCLGGFHYSEGLYSAPRKLVSVNDNLQAQKKKILDKSESITIISPSQWLLDFSQANEVFHNRAHNLVRNTLDQSIFKPIHKASCREALGISKDATVLMIASDSLENRRKGIDILAEALAHLKTDAQIFLLVVGSGFFEIDSKYPNLQLGTITSEHLLAIAYSAADVLILPSREDNLPNVALEAMSCGIPVVATPSGGISEIVARDVTGIIADATTSQSLCRAISEFIEHKNKYTTSVIRDFAVEQFSEIKHSEELLSIYDQVLK